MRPFFAMIRASFHQALDQKVFWMLAIASTVVIVFTFSMHFGETRLSVLFGAAHVDYPAVFGINPMSLMAMQVLQLAVETLPGVGFLLAIIFTAGFIPALQRRGHIDLYLSRSLSRTTFVLGAFTGGLVFVFVISAYLVTGIYAGLFVAGLRLSPAFLLSIPLITISYALIYSFCAMIGFTMRSTVAAILLTLAVWFVGSQANKLEQIRIATRAEGRGLEPVKRALDGTFGQVVHAVYLIFPKMADLDELESRLLASLLDADLRELISKDDDRMAFVPGRTDAVVSTAANAAFLVLMLALSCFAMKRRDL